MNYSFKFIVPESKKLSNGQNHLYLRFTANRKTSIFKLPQFEFLLEHWNNEKQLFYRTNPNYLQYTKLLSNYSLKASEIINKYVLESKNLTLEDFKKHFFNENFGNQDFFIFVESIIKNNVTFRPATIDGYISELNKLRLFKKQVFFNNIDMKFLNDYQTFMTKINNCANTQNKTFRFLRQIINKAIDENLLTENIVNKFKFSKVTIKSDNLEKFEIKKLHELYFNNLYQNNLQKTLQYFLFGLNTGLPFPDLKNLKFNQIVKKEVNNEIKEILIYDRIKTGNHVEIPLNEIALKLIPYENKKSDNDKIFKVFEVQTTNRYLKKILDFAGINKNISWHKLRHSASTIMYNSTKDMKATSKFLGHKSVRTTELYLKDNIESLCNAVNSLV